MASFPPPLTLVPCLYWRYCCSRGYSNPSRRGSRRRRHTRPCPGYDPEPPCSPHRQHQNVCPRRGRRNAFSTPLINYSNNSAVLKIKSTTSSNFCPITLKPFFSRPPCHQTSSKSQKNSCAIPSASSSKRMNLPSKVSNSSTLPSKRKTGNSTLSPICTKPSPSLKPSSLATP